MTAVQKRWGISLLFLAGYTGISLVHRTDFGFLMAIYAALFALYIFGTANLVEMRPSRVLLVVVALRLPFFFSLPLLSDDFYRFVWDGLLICEGLNPFGRIPSHEIITNFSNPEFARFLFEHMNSPNYASPYVTFNQVIFGASAYLGNNNLLSTVNFMRGSIILGEMSLYLLLLARRSDFRKMTLWYLLNPLVIIEGVGNVHFEALMVSFMGMALIELSRQRYLNAGIWWVTSVLVKLVTLIHMPMIFFKLPRKIRIQYTVVAAIYISIFLALLEPWNRLPAFSQGMGLYFTHFEFNASIYYAVAWFSEPFMKGHPVHVIGPAMGIISALLIVYVSYRMRKVWGLELALIVYLIYLLFWTTVHPWYLLPVVFLSIVSRREYILIWSFTVWLSYSHYVGEIGPKPFLIWIEYISLGVAIALEHRKREWLYRALRG